MKVFARHGKISKEKYPNEYDALHEILESFIYQNIMRTE